MNITQEKIDNLNATVIINVELEDYEEKVNTVLKDYRRKANVPGFRPGKVPAGMIKKMYGNSVLVDEVNKLVSESLFKYIQDEKLHLLGDPLPSKNQKVVDFDTQTKYEFLFDLGLAPEFELNLSKMDKVTYYDIKVENKFIDETVTNYRNQYGNMQNIDIVEDNSSIKGKLLQLDKDGVVLENGITVDGALILIQYIKNEDIKNKLIGANVNEIIAFNPKKAFDNDTEVASLLKIDKSEVENINSDFNLEIQEITKLFPAEINQELYDRIFGKDKVKSDEEFKEKIHDMLKERFVLDSDYKLLLDTKDKLINKLKLELPNEFLKRWVKATNKEITDEQIEKDFPVFSKDLNWQLIKDKIIKANDLKVTEEEILNQAITFTYQQFQQYGLTNLESSHIETYAKEMLKKEEEKQKITDSLFENKIKDYIKNTIKLDSKEVSVEDFNKLFEDNTKK